MRLKGFLLPKIILLVGIVVIAGLIIYRERIREFRSFNLKRIGIYLDNFFFDAGPQPKRRMPISLAMKETQLKLYFGQPFLNFSEDDWNTFWGIIYSGFARDEPERPGLPRRKRQLSPDEIALELANVYPSPFSSFREEHWRMFFEVIFSK